MSVTVDQEPLAAEEMGLETVGQVLAHLQRDNRLVIHILIDGQEPDLRRIGAVRQSNVHGHTLYIETANPKTVALEALDEVASQLDEADRLKGEAAELLQKGQTAKAMERLSGCFTTWQAAQESVTKTGQLLRIDLDMVIVGDQSLVAMLDAFGEQLKQIKTTLEDRDFVSLCDILVYETTETSDRWREALDALRAAIEEKR